MTNQSKRVSFYPDDSKNKEFLKRLKCILNHKNSSIAECSIQKSLSESFCVFIIPKNPKYSFSNIVFNFSIRFDREACGDFYEYYEKEGLNRHDIEQLNNLFNDYTFENYYEGLFFASKFFTKKKTPLNLYLKFSENEKENKYIVDGHKVARYYSIVDKENLDYLLENKSVIEGSPLVKCNTYGLSTYDNENEVLQKYKDKYLSKEEELFVIEHYRDYETVEYFLLKIFKVVDEKLVEQDLKSFISE